VTARNRRIGIVMFLCLLVVTSCNRPLRNLLASTDTSEQSRPPVVAGTSEGTLPSGGATRHYLLHIPPSYKAGVAVPLVINFHGFSSNSRQEEVLTGMSAKADQEGFIVVYPDGLDATWYPGHGANGEADLRFIRDLIAWIENNYSIDPKRIYATGISNGGGMANRVGCDMADVIAAIAPDSGAYNFWQDCSPSRPVPVLAFHGLDDHIVPYEGGTPEAMLPPIEKWAASWAARNGCADSPDISTAIKTVTVRTWTNCREDAEVILYSLANHGHSWPGSSVMPAAITSHAVNATDVMWDFFVKHPMP